MARRMPGQGVLNEKMYPNEIMVKLKGYIYFPTNCETADKALDQMLDALENAGVNIDNLDIGDVELRNDEGSTIDALVLIDLS